MPIARSGPFWRRLFLLLAALVIASYVWYAMREMPHGGSRPGLVYGISGWLLILLLAFFGIRKRWYRSRFGTLEQWMQSHIYLGLLAMLILLCHSGGRFNDRVAVTTLVLVAIVVLSGIGGAVLYVTVPRLLTEVESNLPIEELSDQLNQLARSMARIASGKSASFQRIHGELLKESTPGWLAGWRLLVSRRRNRRLESAGVSSEMLALVGRDEQDDLRQMLVISRQRREILLRLIYQQRYKNLLEAWLYIHVPFTAALLLFALLHIGAAFYYGRIRL